MPMVASARRRASAAGTGCIDEGWSAAVPGLYEPLNTLKPFADGVWIIDGPLVHMAAFGARMPFPTRMTVVRLADGGL